MEFQLPATTNSPGQPAQKSGRQHTGSTRKRACQPATVSHNPNSSSSQDGPTATAGIGSMAREYASKRPNRRYMLCPGTAFERDAASPVGCAARTNNPCSGRGRTGCASSHCRARRQDKPWRNPGDIRHANSRAALACSRAKGEKPEASRPRPLLQGRVVAVDSLDGLGAWLSAAMVIKRLMAAARVSVSPAVPEKLRGHRPRLRKQGKTRPA